MQNSIYMPIIPLGLCDSVDYEKNNSILYWIFLFLYEFSEYCVEHYIKL